MLQWKKFLYEKGRENLKFYIRRLFNQYKSGPMLLPCPTFAFLY